MKGLATNSGAVAMKLNEFYDRVLEQIELGYATEAMARLTGMLDQAADDDTEFGEIRRTLSSHPLFALIAMEPATAAAQHRRPDRIDRAVTRICAPRAVKAPAPTACMLRQTLYDSAFYRAIRARVDYGSNLLAGAWREGRKVAVLGDVFVSEFADLRGRDLSNLTVYPRTDVQAARLKVVLDRSITIRTSPGDPQSSAPSKDEPPIDLLYMPRSAETLSTADLAATVLAASDALAEHGSIVIPAFSKERIGRGWQSICLNWGAEHHDTDDLAARLGTANLSCKAIDDSGGCFSWFTIARSGGGVRAVGAGR